MIFFSCLVVSILLSWGVTGLLRRYALNKDILDVPNSRSSHSIPTPRGGGLAIVVTFLTGLLLLAIFGELKFTVLISLVVGALLVATVGLVDDQGHVAPQYRLLVHSISAIWAITWLNIPNSQIELEQILPLSWLGYFVAAVALVWFLNLFNFMDGIDGFAASEAIFIAGCGLLFATIEGHNCLQLIAVILIGAIFGFLIWNWPPAKIFMGDAGSGFLGITLGIYAYWAVIEDIVSIWTWIIILGVFLVDATFTLMRRFLQGLPWYEAHCSHAYQHAARRWGHLRVTLSVNLINLLWLLPIAYISNSYPGWGPFMALLALLPLLVLVFLLRAGLEEKKSLADEY